MNDTSASRAFEEIAARWKEPLEARLRAYATWETGCPQRLQDAIQYSLLAPGKRLRPLLVLSAAEACGRAAEAALPAACAVECVHAYSLIHDDLPAMDDDDMRRGRPSCHKAFDEATAILAGDALLARAFEILARDTRPAEVAARCCAELGWAAGAGQLVGGQADDLAAEGQAGSLGELEAIHRRKTGAMLIVSLRLGGLVAAAHETRLQQLTDFGRDLGLAFQIIDDLLDHSGTTEAMGKRAGQDRERGKLTFPMLLGESASRRRATELGEAAISHVSPWGPSSATLISLAQFVLQRNR